jgi:hypothetical protein
MASPARRNAGKSKWHSWRKLKFRKGRWPVDRRSVLRERGKRAAIEEQS